jgi:nucleoside-diphosphate-sugar epimerase
MRILITGSSGFIGLNLIKYLNKTNFKVLAIYNKNKPKLHKSKNIEFFKHDIKNYKKISVIKKFKPNIVIHLAWKDIPNFTFKKSFENLTESINFLNSVINIDTCKKIIVSGSSYEKNIDKNNYYFVWAKKSLREWLTYKCKEKKIDFGWLRIFYVFGPGQRKKSLINYLCNSLKKNKKPIINNPFIFNDYIYIDDVIKAITRLMGKKLNYDTYDIGSGNLVPVSKICSFVEKIILKKNIYFKKNQNLLIKKKFHKNKKANLQNYRSKFKKIKTVSIYEGLKKTIRYNLSI